MDSNLKAKTKDLAKQIALMFVEIETYESALIFWIAGPIENEKCSKLLLRIRKCIILLVETFYGIFYLCDLWRPPYSPL